MGDEKYLDLVRRVVTLSDELTPSDLPEKDRYRIKRSIVDLRRDYIRYLGNSSPEPYNERRLTTMIKLLDRRYKDILELSWLDRE